MNQDRRVIPPFLKKTLQHPLSLMGEKQRRLFFFSVRPRQNYWSKRHLTGTIKYPTAFVSDVNGASAP